MSIGPILDLRQAQSLVMTPQLQQAIKLLQLNNLELAEYLKEELEKNPLLERDENEDQEKTQKEQDFIESQSNLDEIQNLKSGNSDENQAEPAKEDLDTDFDNLWTGDSMAGAGKGGNLQFDNNDDFSYEKTLSDTKSLRDHLQEQLFLKFKEDEHRNIGMALIDRLTPAGYLREEIDQIVLELNCSKETLVEVLSSAKQFDPTGIFAKDLKECLALQLKEKDRLDPAMETFIENIELLAKREHEKLMKKCGVDLEDLKDMVAEIQSLNPKPAGEFDHFISQTVVPDVIMRPRKTETGDGWFIELNNHTLPRVLVNKHYYAEISKMTHSKEEKKFVEDQFQNANWMVRAMDQRAQTILKVASEIVRQQDAFFAYGIQYLKPMTLKDIADKVDVHESTVSRVTSSKYIGTPRGVFELKFFFGSGLGSTDGGVSHSSESVRNRIKELIDEETPKKVLSDDKIAAVLKEEGVDIARRTVAKYREGMGIPSSAQRKREKRSVL